MQSPSLPEMTRAVLSCYGWSQSDLAQRCGVRPSTINRLVNDRAGSATWELGSQIAALWQARPMRKAKA